MDTIYKVIVVLVPMILSLSVHEFAHAWAAHKLGDDTARRSGRLTLNPLAHIDPIGTLLLPIILTVTGSVFFFGWAKPVPVNRFNFRRTVSMRSGDMITAGAGPLSNVIMAFITSGIFFFMAINMNMSPQTSPVMRLLVYMFQINIALAVFNLIPVPPLDGHYFLPESIKEKMMQYQMFFFIGLILLINVFSTVLYIPMSHLGNALQSFWIFVLGG
jgi:Zn-dependent protease